MFLFVLFGLHKSNDGTAALSLCRHVHTWSLALSAPVVAVDPPLKVTLPTTPPPPCFCRRSTYQQALVRPTVAKSFLASMRELNTTLLETTCNFVRCIKPNAEMECGVYDNK